MQRFHTRNLAWIGFSVAVYLVLFGLIQARIINPFHEITLVTIMINIIYAVGLFGDLLTVRVDEQSRIEGQPQVVETQRGDGGDIVAGEEGVAEVLPEGGRILGSQGLGDEVLEPTR